MYFKLIGGTYNALTVKIKAKLYGGVLNYFLIPRRGSSFMDEILEFLAMFQFRSISFIVMRLLIPVAICKWYLSRNFPSYKMYH
jgi:hypothetical protein